MIIVLYCITQDNQQNQLYLVQTPMTITVDLAIAFLAEEQSIICLFCLWCVMLSPSFIPDYDLSSETFSRRKLFTI